MDEPGTIPGSEIAGTHDADVVIIGAGHAGTMAARAAAELGASVIVLEQQDRERQRILGIGEIGCINSQWQRSRGVPDVDIDEFMDDWQLRTGNRSDYRLVRRFAESCGEVFDRFIEPLTQDEKDSIHPMLFPPSPNMPSSLNGIRAWPGTPNMGMELQNRAVKANQSLAEGHGAGFLFGTRAERLVKDGGRVTGVIATMPDGSYARFIARRGVVLAAGDYSSNAEMCRDLLAEADDLIDEGDMTGHGWDGSGIRMGVWAGGRLEPRSQAAMGGNYSFPGFDLIGSTPTLRVNCHGRRYSNEGFGTHILAAVPGARQPDGINWAVFDSDILEQITYQTPNHGALDYTDPRDMAKLTDALEKARSSMGDEVEVRDKAGSVRPLVCADTVHDLGERLFGDPEDRMAFEETVARYNAVCKEGRDTDFGKDPRLLHPISRPPFYACGNMKDSHHPRGQSLKLLVTVGGLMVDSGQRVLGMDFEPIPGLYATGNCSGCRFGAQYTTSLPGQSISMAQTMGWVLGKDLAGARSSM